MIDRRSTSGYCTFVGGNLVSWRSKKQSVVARSSAEAEFRALALRICETLWVEKLLQELKVHSSPLINYIATTGQQYILHITRSYMIGPSMSKLISTSSKRR